MDVAGLVSSIIAFVDFSWTIVRGTYEVYQSTSGVTKENVHVGNVLEDLKNVTDNMRREISGQDEDEMALLELGHQCRELSSELTAILQNLTSKKRSGLQSLNIMFKSMLNKDKVRGIEERLGKYQQQMIVRLQMMIMKQTAAGQESLRLTQDIRATLEQLLRKNDANRNSSSVLRRLHFDGMYERAERISDAAHGTFDWFLKDATSPMLVPGEESRLDKIKSESVKKLSDFVETGSGVFFLRGKPGSGKSTLMKHLIVGRGHPVIREKLQKWAGQNKLICVSILFLLHGSPLQRSLEGFYRTFLFELLCQCPDLVKTLFPESQRRRFLDDPYQSSFRFEMLCEAWAKFRSLRNHSTRRFCIFIDGLDELEGSSGDRLEFVQDLRKWADSGNTKIICSGRPNAEFNIAFDQASQRIDLQDLTRSDIQEILRQMFAKTSQRITNLTEENFERLIRNIVDQSEGVILWAVIVGKNIEDDIIHSESSFEDLEKSIRKMPPKIEKMFDEMWKTILHNTIQQRIVRSVLEIAILGTERLFSSQEPLAICLYWLQNGLNDPGFPYSERLQVLTDVELKSRLEDVRARLVKHTKHLVEVKNGTHSSAACQFVHRSAKEFVEPKLGSLCPGSATSDQTIELYLRLRLMYEISNNNPNPMHALWAIFGQWDNYVQSKWESQRTERKYQIPHKIMTKLSDVMSSRINLLEESTVSTAERAAVYRWEIIRQTPAGVIFARTSRGTPISFIHCAIFYHQIDYVTRVFRNKTVQLDRRGINLGLLLCAVGEHPSHELVILMAKQGADPDEMVTIYDSKSHHPQNVPIWLLFYYRLAKLVVILRCDDPWFDEQRMWKSDFFLIMEHFLRMGRGVNVNFIATTSIETRPSFEYTRQPEADKMFGVDLAQLVRIAKPDNAEYLMSLLRTQPASYPTMVLDLINSLLQPQSPWRALPEGAVKTPYRTVTDDYLRSNDWLIWGAFDGEFEVMGDFYYYMV